MPALDWTWAETVTLDTIGSLDVAVLERQGDWTTYLQRDSYAVSDGESIQVWLQTDDDASGAFILGLETSGTEGTAAYNRLALEAASGKLRVNQRIGTAAVVTYDLLKTYEADTWYVLTIVIDDYGGLVLRVHEGGDTSVSAQYQTTAFPTGKDWRFMAQSHTGNPNLASYSEQPVTRFACDVTRKRTLTIEADGDETRYLYRRSKRQAEPASVRFPCITRYRRAIGHWPGV